jgi:hypothetical protein
MSSGAVCASCNRAIDAFAKLCPYCGANPATGERLDTQAILQEVFRPREVTTTDSVLDYARQRQGVVIPIIGFIAFLVLAGVHQFVSARNATAVTDAPAVPLSELTDVTKQADETTPVPLPELDFQYNGRPNAMRTYIVERGATTPPEVLAARAAAAPQPPAAAAPRPGAPAAGAPAAGAPVAGAPATPGGVAPRPAVPPQQQPARPAPRPR